MLTSLFASRPSAEEVPRSSMGPKAVHDLAEAQQRDIEVFAAHTMQVTDQLKRVQKQRDGEREAAQQERQALESRWLLRLRCSRLEASLHAGVASRDLRAVGRSLKLWAEVIGLMRRQSLEQRQEREQQLQLRLRDSGRTELLQERVRLNEQAVASEMVAQQLRAALGQRSQELERTVVRDTMAFELWAADALRTSQVLREVKRTHAEAEAVSREEIARLGRTLETERAEGAERASSAEAAVASALSGEVVGLEFELRKRGATQAVVVRLAVQHSVLHRYWKSWAVAASLLLREAGGALLQLELSKQQQRGAHTRLQAEVSAELAQARVENLEGRALLSKAEILNQLKPGHELVVDKEMLIDQRRALQAAHESAASAHLAAAAHRVGEEVLMSEVRDAEETLLTSDASARSSAYGRDEAMAREFDERLQYERSSVEFLRMENAHTTAELRRSRCEMRVLARALQSAEAEPSPPLRMLPAGGTPPRPRPASPGRAGGGSSGSGAASGKPAARPARPPRPK